jgi:hypothetical protein
LALTTGTLSQEKHGMHNLGTNKVETHGILREGIDGTLLVHGMSTQRTESTVGALRSVDYFGDLCLGRPRPFFYFCFQIAGSLARSARNGY